jgi:hypothetical protein
MLSHHNIDGVAVILNCATVLSDNINPPATTENEI